jgi:hypothetical protein
MANKQSERKKKRKQRKKRQIGTKSDPTIIHAPPRKKKGCQDESNDERNHDSNHRS